MRYFLSASFILLLSSCANIGTLGGGPEDKQAPQLIGSNINKTNFKGRQIVLQFDEYVTLNNAEKNIHLFPKHCKMKFQISHKKVLINLDSNLHENTTYSLVVDKGIQDNNANNPFIYNTVFSTGPYTDSSYIEIRIPEYEQYKFLKVCINNSDGRDSFKSFENDYILDVNSNIIRFTGLTNTPRNIWLFTDENSDNKPDHYKASNFILKAATDSSYELNPVLWIKPFEIRTIQTDLKIQKVFYNQQMNYSTSIPNSLNTVTEDFLYYTSDSALLKANNNNDFKGFIDTVDQISFKRDLTDMVLKSFRIIKMKNDYLLSYELPVYYIDSLSESTIKKVKLFTKYEPDTVMIYSKKYNDEDTFIISSIPKEESSKLTYLKLQITDSLKIKYDIKLYKESQEYLSLNNTNQYEDYIEPGTYKIEIYPKDYLYHYNPFNSKSALLPIYEKTMYLKASWEEILSIKL